MSEDNKNNDNGSAPGDSTVLSVTEVEKLQTQTPDPDATEIMSHDEPAHTLSQESSDTEATILSSTEMENLQTQPEDPDATQVMQSNEDNDATEIMDATRELGAQTEATIISGGTEAISEAISTSFSPRVGVGSVIKDRFTLEKLLGRGGMGEVYLATDKRKLEAQDKNPYVAFKVLGDNFKRHPQAFIAMQREARKTQELAHPNIVTVYDFDRQGDTVYITMEALSGKPMDEEIRADVRPIEESVRIIEQCSQGLAYAHQKGLVHSDLKPGNLFITAEGNVKLLDFGIARAFKSGKDLEQNAGDQKDDTVFDAGELGALTPAYATVEMINGEEPHPADDIYAMGLIAYELLTGKHPFDKLMATKAEEQGLTPERIEGISKQQWLAIEGALAFRRENRIQDAQEFFDKFTAKSKTPLYILATLVLAAFIGVGSISFFVEPELGPEIPFEELPQATQDQVKGFMSEADIALKFNDYNAVFQLLDQAFELHPYNPDIMAKQETAISAFIEAISSQPKQAQIQHIETLMSYKSLTNNETLNTYKDSL